MQCVSSLRIENSIITAKNQQETRSDAHFHNLQNNSDSVLRAFGAKRSMYFSSFVKST